MAGESSKRKAVEAPKPTVTPKPLGNIIPGSAGILQKAMYRRAKGKGLEEDYVSTQQFMENALHETAYDDTWEKEPWLTIENLGYCDLEGYMNVATVMEEEKALVNGRCGLMAGVVKGYKRTDVRHRSGIFYGGFNFTDKTGSMRAQIGGIDVQNGDAIVIQDSVVFNYDRSRYNPALNIMPDNLVYLAKSPPPAESM